MKTKRTILTKEEQDILISATLYSHGRLLNIREIGQRIGMPDSKVNTLIHKICIKLEAQDKNEAIIIALKRGDIKLNEFWSLDELAELFDSLSPDMLSSIANIVRQKTEQWYLLGTNGQTIHSDRNQNILCTDVKESDRNFLKTKDIVLTKEEREVLILCGLNQNGKHLNNTEIAQRLGMSANKVNTLIHQVCVKLGAHTKNRAINLALTRGDIILTDLWSLDELAELLCSLGPEMLKEIAYTVSQGQDHKYLLKKRKRTMVIGRRQDDILTSRERDVVILAGVGLTNKEIARKLYMSTGSVGVLLNRVCDKLGVSKRSEATISALKQRAISIVDLSPLENIVKSLTPLGSESIEKIAKIIEQKMGQDLTPTDS